MDSIKGRSVANRDEPLAVLYDGGDQELTSDLPATDRVQKGKKSSMWRDSASNLQDKLFDK